MHKGHGYFQKENFSLGFFCCRDVFAFLPGGELILVPCAFLFIAFLPAPDCPCNEFWEGRLRACFLRLWTAVLMLSPSRTSWTTLTPVCKAFFPITLAPLKVPDLSSYRNNSKQRYQCISNILWLNKITVNKKVVKAILQIHLSFSGRGIRNNFFW